MATYYWVKTSGGSPSSSGTWNATNTGNWSTSSGGSPGAGPPTSADDVVFDAESDNGAIFTVTVGTGAVCRNLTASNLDFTMTLTVNAALGIYGSLSLPSTNVNFIFSNVINFLSTSTGNTVDFGVSTISCELIFNGSGGSWLMQRALTVPTTVTLSAGTLNLNGFDLTVRNFSSNNSNTRSIAFGSNKITLTGNGLNIWAVQTATNFTYTGTPDIYANYSGSTATRGLFHGTIAGATEANAPNFYITAGSDSVSIGPAKNIVFSGFSGAAFFSQVPMYGDLTLNSGMTTTANTSARTFAATSGTQVITTAGVTLNFPITVNAPGATVSLADNLTLDSARALTFTAGTLDINGKIATVGTFASTGVATRTLAFGTSGNITVVGSGTSAWNATGPGLATTGTNSTISMTSASAKTFAGGGFNYAAALDQGGAGTLTVASSNTFDNITNTYGSTGATTITFTAGTTQTVSQFTASGTSGKLLTLNSSSTTSRFFLLTLSQTISVSFCSIRNSFVYGRALWSALRLNGNVDAGNNIGWIFVRKTARAVSVLRRWAV